MNVGSLQILEKKCFKSISRLAFAKHSKEEVKRGRGRRFFQLDAMVRKEREWIPTLTELKNNLKMCFQDSRHVTRIWLWIDLLEIWPMCIDYWNKINRDTHVCCDILQLEMIWKAFAIETLLIKPDFGLTSCQNLYLVLENSHLAIRLAKNYRDKLHFLHQNPSEAKENQVLNSN